MHVATDCKSVKIGSIPIPASIYFNGLRAETCCGGKPLSTRRNIPALVRVRSASDVEVPEGAQQPRNINALACKPPQEGRYVRQWLATAAANCGGADHG